MGAGRARPSGRSGRRAAAAGLAVGSASLGAPGPALALGDGAAAAQDALADFGTAGMVFLLAGGSAFVFSAWSRKPERQEAFQLGSLYAWAALALLAWDDIWPVLFPFAAFFAEEVRFCSLCFCAASAALYARTASGSRRQPAQVAAWMSLGAGVLGITLPGAAGEAVRDVARGLSPLVPLGWIAFWAPRTSQRRPGATWLTAVGVLLLPLVAALAGWVPPVFASFSMKEVLLPAAALCIIVGTAERVGAYSFQRHFKVEIARDGVLVVTPDRVVVEANAAALKLLDPERPIQTPFPLDLVFSAADVERLGSLLSTERGGPPGAGVGFVEVTVTGAHTPPRVLEAGASRMPQGEHLIVLRDITERRVLEDRLARTDRLDAIGLLAGGIAHDFNNLLQGVLGTAADLRARRGLPADVDRGLGRIERAATRAASLTGQLLAFARGGRFEPRPVVVSGLIEEAAWLVVDGKRGGPDVRLDLAPGLPPVAADAAQIEQVFDNLIRNAVQAMEGRPGAVEVRAFPVMVRDDEAARLGVVAGPYVRVEVTDRGPGIDPQVLPHLFEPFVTTREPGKGTGLGLAVAHGIVERHGGAIRVAATSVSGTTMTVDLPVAVGELARIPDLDERDAVGTPARYEPAPRDTPAPLPARMGLICPRRILFVDDEEVLRTFVSDALSARGYQVTAYADGETALQHMLTPGMDGARPDALVVDMRMPGLDGLDVLESVRAVHPDLPAVLCSGHGPTERIEAFLAMPRSAFLAKPFRVEALEAAIAQAIGEPNAALALH